MKKISYFLLLTFLSLASCASQQRPSWTKGALPAELSRVDHLVGVGIAVQTRDEEGDVKRADNAAFSEIAKQIQVQLKEELVSESEYTSKRNSASGMMEDRSVDRVSIRGTQDIDFTLEGAQIVERFYDERGRCHYSLAVLNKPRTAERLVGESWELLHESQALEDEGIAMVSKGEIIPGIKKLISSTDRHEAACKKRMIASILSSAPAEPVKVKSPLFALQEIISRTSLECVSGDNQKARAGTPLPAPIVVRARYGNEHLIPIPSLPLATSLPGRDGKPEPPVLTDEKGIAEIPCSSIVKTGAAKNTIRIAPAWDEVVRAALNGLPAAWENRFGMTRLLLVSYHLRTEGTTSVIVVAPAGFSVEDGAYAISEDIVVQPLVDRLKAAGFMVKGIETCKSGCTSKEQIGKHRARSDLLVVANGTLAFSSWRANIPLYRASLSLTCYDYLRGEIIGSAEGQSISGALEKRVAAEKALAEAAGDNIQDFIQGIQDKLQ